MNNPMSDYQVLRAFCAERFGVELSESGICNLAGNRFEHDDTSTRPMTWLLSRLLEMDKFRVSHGWKVICHDCGHKAKIGIVRGHGTLARCDFCQQPTASRIRLDSEMEILELEAKLCPQNST